MKINFRGFAAAATMGLAAVCFVMIGSCEEGDSDSPGTVTDLSYFWRADALVWNGMVGVGAANGPADTRLLAWVATGDNDYEGQASLYDVRFVRSSDVARWGYADGASALIDYWDSALQVTGEPFPANSGALEQLFLPFIDPGSTIWLALKVYDEIGLESSMSNILGPLRLRRLMVPTRTGPGQIAAGFGTSLSSAGDVNLDGFLDIVLGSPAEGKVVIILNAGNQALINYRANTQGIFVLSAPGELVPTMTITGMAADEFGAAVSGGFRLNVDDLHDVAAGAPGFDPGGLTDAGAVFIYLGRFTLPPIISASLVDITITGQAAGDRFGAAISPGSDLNLDATDEILVGAPNAGGVGSVYVLSGSGMASGSASQALAIIKGEGAGDQFGSVVSSIQDVNGDGISDIAIGAPFHDEPGMADAGAVYIFYGGDSGVIGFKRLGLGQGVIDLSVAKADVTIRGSAPGRRFGKAITAGGDLAGDLDPIFDFAVSGGNTVYVFFGGPFGAVPFPLTGSNVEGLDINASAKLLGTAGQQFGAAIIGPGDLNRDGISDLVVGAPGADACYVYPGPIINGMTFKEIILAPVSKTGFGSSLAGPGDTNLDGIADLLIGAPTGGEAYFSF